MTPTVIRADARCLPIADSTVDLIVTSPPYFALRSYQDGGEHYAGQVGAEATPAEFVDALIACTREWLRVLKPSGSLWVNLGDKYSQRVQVRRSSHQPGIFPDKFEEFGETWAERAAKGATRMPHQNVVDATSGRYIPEKSLMGLPWRYALRCVDELDLILRAEVIWSKPNGLPESVTDRVRRSHEQWFHFTMQPRYFSAVDEIREHHARQDSPRPLGTRNATHFAAFPTEWPRRIIQGWSPAGICVECGEGRRPVVAKEGAGPVARAHRHLPGYRDPAGVGQREMRYEVLGYSCACPTPTAGTRPAVVLDPFGGTGTTALVASVLGRLGVSVDLSSDYCRLALWRTTDPGERARAMRVEKPPKQADGQLDLLGGVA